VGLVQVQVQVRVRVLALRDPVQPARATRLEQVRPAAVAQVRALRDLRPALQEPRSS
jgi:hypothetical protein